MIEEITVLVINLEKQKLLYSKMYELSGGQVALFQVSEENLDLDAIARLMAEQQNLIEQIDSLEEAAVSFRKKIAGLCGLALFSMPPVLERLPQAIGERFGKVVGDLTEIMQNMDERDQECRKHIQARLEEVGGKLKSLRSKNKKVQAYLGSGGYSQEGRFMDHKK